MKAQNLKTREEVLADFARKGISISGWSKAHGVCRATVRGVLYGRLSGRIGKSHIVAVLLGIKEGDIVEDGSHE